jgi:hypothetical protein
MQRRFEVVDVVVAIGMCATILAGGMMFLAANGQLAVIPAWQSGSERPSGEGDSMQWLQPVLGRAIVDQFLLDRHNEKVVSAAEARLKGVTGEVTRWQNSPFGYLDSIKVTAARAEADHAIRMQAVIGRAIVNFTSRGVRSHMLSEAREGVGYNARMIGAAATQGQGMDTRFLADWQPSLGRAIIIAGQDDARISTVRPERLGAAIIQLIAVRGAYEDNRAAIQSRHVSAAVGGSNGVESGALRQARSVRSPALMAGTHRGRPGFSMSMMVVASLVLMGLFVTGLLATPNMPLAKADEQAPFDPVSQVRFKTM